MRQPPEFSLPEPSFIPPMPVVKPTGTDDREIRFLGDLRRLRLEGERRVNCAMPACDLPCAATRIGESNYCNLHQPRHWLAIETSVEPDAVTQLDRIEQKIDMLLAALAEDEDPEAQDVRDAWDLDGHVVARERDQGEAL